jgi:hypothetical protein
VYILFIKPGRKVRFTCEWEGNNKVDADEV